MGPVRILIVGNDPLARAGLATLLSSHTGCLVVGQAEANADLAMSADTYMPDVVLWDLGRSHSPDRVPSVNLDTIVWVGLAGSAEAASLAWAGGARGILARDAEPARIIAACQAVVEGLAVVDSVFSSAVFSSRPHGSPESGSDLTNRERQVLTCLAKGQPNKEIARQLGISEHTVKFHVNSILSKLNVSSRTEAVVAATRLGLVLL